MTLIILLSVCYSLLATTSLALTPSPTQSTYGFFSLAQHKLQHTIFVAFVVQPIHHVRQHRTHLLNHHRFMIVVATSKDCVLLHTMPNFYFTVTTHVHHTRYLVQAMIVIGKIIQWQKHICKQ